MYMVGFRFRRLEHALKMSLAILLIFAVNVLQIMPREILLASGEGIEPTGNILMTCQDRDCEHFGLFAVNSQLPSVHPGLSRKQLRWRRPWRTERSMTTKDFCWYYGFVMLMLSGDINFNPGPTQCNYKYPCGYCLKPVKINQKGIFCDGYQQWFHIKCLPETIAISDDQYELLSESDSNWYCYECQLPVFSEPFFNQTVDPSELLPNSAECQDNTSVADDENLLQK